MPLKLQVGAFETVLYCQSSHPSQYPWSCPRAPTPWGKILLIGALVSSFLQAGGQSWPLAGHSASLSGSIMTVIGGYHPTHGFNSKVLQYNILMRRWSTMSTDNVATPPAGNTM